MIGHAASERAATDTAPAPAYEYVAPAWAVTSAARAPVIECLAPEPGVKHRAPAPASQIKFLLESEQEPGLTKMLQKAYRILENSPLGAASLR